MANHNDPSADKAAADKAAADKAKPTPPKINDALVKEKVSAGLSKDQAVEVVRAQAAHDAGL